MVSLFGWRRVDLGPKYNPSGALGSQITHNIGWGLKTDAYQTARRHAGHRRHEHEMEWG